jgi:hypothetical protein
MTEAQITKEVHAHLAKDHSPPAPHPERRAGQRWRVHYGKYPKADGVIELGSRRTEGWNCRNAENTSFPGWIHDSHWEANNEHSCTMTLLSDAPSPASEPAWKERPHPAGCRCNACKPAEKAKDVRVQCCRIGGEMAKEARPCPFHVPKVTAGPLMLLNDFDLLPDATEDDQRRLALWLDNAEDGP